MIDPGAVVAALFGTYLGIQIVEARKRGRIQWLTPVGRPPRDLFAQRRVNFVFNLVHEWLWIGFAVVIASFFTIFFDAIDGLTFYVMYLGIAMMVACLVIVPLCVARAELNPKYEAETPAPSP